MANKMITPQELVEVVADILRQHPGKCMSPHAIWDQICLTEPNIAERVRQRVKTYKDPRVNTPVWFVTWSFSYLGKLPGFTASNTSEHPEMKTEGVWLIACKQ